jgi:esterase/lipase superfamily enzyme
VNFLVAGTTPWRSGRARAPRRSFSILAIVLVAASLAACASRPESGYLSAVALVAPGAVDHTILVATTRERDPRPGTLFNGDRASATDYAEITVSVPPTHRESEIEWAKTPPGDPNADFVVRDEHYLDGDKAFVQTLNTQFALRPLGKRRVFLDHRNKLGYIILAAPDIDIDVFKSQLRRFGKLQRPFYVVLSKDDKALWLSGTIAGGVSRVGNDPRVGQLAELGATVIDLTDVEATDSAHHDKFDQLAAVAPQLRGVLSQGIASNPHATDLTETAAAGA